MGRRAKKGPSAEASHQLAEHATDEALTPAEMRVLRLIAEGNANKEIAAQLSVSEETVKGQVRNILSKLGANDRTHAAMIGLKRGIIEFSFARKSGFGGPFEAFGLRREFCNLKTLIETTLLDIRPWVARRRPFIDEGRSRYCVGFAWGYGTSEWAFARICYIARGHDRCRVTSGRRLMDARRGSTRGGYRGVARLLASRRCVELHHASYPGCRPGTARTWRLVGRCSPFWLEAHRPSRPKELSLTPLLG